MSATSHQTDRRASRLVRLAAMATATALLCSFQPARGDDTPPLVLPSLALQPNGTSGAEPVIVSQSPAAAPQAVTFDDGWVMQINPAPVLRTEVNGKSYQSVYNSIPYRRSEYLANPSYRHDTTVELLFGQMRPTVIHRTSEPVRIVNPRPSLYRPYLMSRSELWSVPWWASPTVSALLPYTPLPPVLGAIRY